jgi:hypothetical protein
VQSIRSHLSFANVISVIALFVALGGASYAAVTLPKNSVGAKQIKKNGVGASEIKKNAVRASEIKSNAVSGGDVKDSGLTGADVADGSLGGADLADDSLTAADIAGNTLEPEVGPDAFARVQPDGTLLPVIGDFPATSKVITNDNVTHPNPGVYCIINLPFQPSTAMVASDNAGASSATANDVVVSVAVERGNNLVTGGCPAPPITNARVVATQWTDTTAPANVNKGFVIWFER